MSRGGLAASHGWRQDRTSGRPTGRRPSGAGQARLTVNATSAFAQRDLFGWVRHGCLPGVAVLPAGPGAAQGAAEQLGKARRRSSAAGHRSHPGRAAGIATDRRETRDWHPADRARYLMRGRRFRAYTAKHLDALTARAGLGAGERLAVRAVATVLPFRTNAYVIDELIDWDAAPDDPIYRLVFPQADMLPEADVGPIAGLLAGGAPEAEVRARRARGADAAEPAPGRAAGAEHPGPRRRAAARACSTSTRRRCWCSPSRARPATRTARTASGGRSSWTSPT